MEIFDVHRHLGYLGETEEEPIDEQIDKHLNVMDNLGVDRALIMPSHAYPNPNGLADTRELNNRIAATRDEHTDKFPVALGTVEPMYGEPGLKEIDRMMTELNLDGVSWHNRWQRSYVDDPMMYELIERAADHDAVVLLHAYFESNLEEPWRAFRIVENFPDVDFIVADAFSGAKEGKKVTYWASQLDRNNVLFDTSGAKHIYKQIRPFIEQVGVENIVFGAGGYSNNERTSLPVPIEQIQNAEFTDKELEALFYDNAARLLDL